jgi:hypothetical protein
MTGGDVVGLVPAYEAADKIGTIMIAPKSGIGVFIIRTNPFCLFPKSFAQAVWLTTAMVLLSGFASGSAIPRWSSRFKDK